MDAPRASTVTTSTPKPMSILLSEDVLIQDFVESLSEFSNAVSVDKRIHYRVSM